MNDSSGKEITSDGGVGSLFSQPGSVIWLSGGSYIYLFNSFKPEFISFNFQGFVGLY